MKKKTPTKIKILRTVLALLIVANMAVIYLFSAQSGEESDKTSGAVTKVVAEILVPDFSEKPQAEQDAIIERIHPPMRKLAHMAEFGSLGALTYLFLLTWRGGLVKKYGASLAFTLLYAATDEWHQSLTAARGPRVTDVLIDLSGAAITCTAILAVVIFLILKKNGVLHPPMKKTTYRIQNSAFPKPLRIAIASDLHGETHRRLFALLAAERPDMILIPGDLADDKQLADPTHPAYDFLRFCAALAPTYYSLGNHEVACYHKGNPWRHPTPVPLSSEVRERIRQTGAVLLDNEHTLHDGIAVCGMGTGINGKKNEPDAELLARFAALPSPRILLCHHPEYFVPYIEKTSIELTVCGHAHGGQWRLFGRGVYAPGQGIFPKYTSGTVRNRCVISRGLGNHTPYPRFFNPRELVIVEVE